MEEWGLDERGARRTTHLIEATYVAFGDARTRVKAHENQRSGGIGSGGEAQAVCLLSSSGKDPEIIHVRNTTFGLGKTESDTSKIHEAEGTSSSNECPQNIWGSSTAITSGQGVPRSAM